MNFVNPHQKKNHPSTKTKRMKKKKEEEYNIKLQQESKEDKKEPFNHLLRTCPQVCDNTP
jgi:hypothetical protein